MDVVKIEMARGVLTATLADVENRNALGAELLELLESRSIGTRRHSDPDLLADAENITAIQNRRRRQFFNRAIRCEGVSEGGGFVATGLRPRSREHGQLVQHDSPILDEDRVGQSRFSGKMDHRAPELGQELSILCMLRPGEVDVDGAAPGIGQLTLADRGAHLSSDGVNQVGAPGLPWC